MPAKIKILKQRIKTRGANISAQLSAKMQKTATTIFLEELARLIPVRTGRLAGGVVVRVGAGRSPNEVKKFNKTKEVSLENLAIASILTGKSTVSIINNVPYASFVDGGTKNQRAQRFFRRARISADVRLHLLGYRKGIS